MGDDVVSDWAEPRGLMPVPEAIDIDAQNGNVFGTRAGLRLLFALMFALLIGCGSQPSNDLAFFRHQVIDPHPDTGRDCCTDVLALGDLNGGGNLDVVLGAQEAERGLKNSIHHGRMIFGGFF
jgi:hypothetical protein